MSYVPGYLTTPCEDKKCFFKIFEMDCRSLTTKKINNLKMFNGLRKQPFKMYEIYFFFNLIMLKVPR